MAWHRLAWPIGIGARTGQYGSVCLAFCTSFKGKAHLSGLRFFIVIILYSSSLFIVIYVFIEVSDGVQLINLTQIHTDHEQLNSA